MDDVKDSRLVAETLVSMLRQHALSIPERAAYTFLGDSDDDATGITFAQLDRRARQIAGHLQSRGMAGERVMLLYPQGLEYLAAFWGCLYAQAIAIPLYPPSPRPRSISRIQAIAADSACRMALTSAQIAAAKRPVFARIAGLNGVELVATDTISQELAEEWRPPALSGNALAYLQYTSGSTATPKGVMISHRNVLHNLELMRRMYALSPEDVFVSWGPFFHDMGLVMGTLLSLYTGFPGILMSPASFAQRPVRWLDAITRYRASISFGSNFAFDLCAEKVTPGQREALDLRSWRVAINGSEPVRSGTLRRFADCFRACGFTERAFYPSYGLAEATLVVSCGRAPHSPSFSRLRVSRKALQSGRVEEVSGADEDAQELVSCGTTYAEDRVLVVDPRTASVVEPGAVGEIWVSGASVALGYWQRPRETAEDFQAQLADSSEGPFLRTGDLGFFHAGELYITGRLKDLIIIRGRNIYPQDVELSAEGSHPGAQPGGTAAFAVDAGEEERLVIVQEIRRGHDVSREAATAAVRRAVAEDHEVQPYEVILIKPGTMFKTSSGKLQRRACREAYVSGQLDPY